MINLYCIRPKGFNIGNDVIYLGVTHFIRQVFQGNYNIISFPATGKYENQRKAGISSQTIYEINQFGNGLIIGGGNLYENGELEINHNALKALDKPMMIFSVSRGKIYNSKKQLVDRTDVMTDINIRAINEKATVSLSRDFATKQYIDNLGCNNHLSGCPTLFINEIPQHIVPIVDTDKTDALISIRTPTLMSIPVNFQYALREQLIKIIELLKTKGYKNIKFLCHDHRDIPFAASFTDIDYLYTEDVYTYLTYLRNTRLNISFRLHSFIPALAYDTPTIKISYDQRAVSMLETIGMQDWNINLLNDNIVQEIENRLNNLGDLQNIKNKVKSTLWTDLKSTILKNCEKFAEKVKETC
jgi:polysaccharide pyruvyl transferase WcaK-like protein